jgi:glycosyltransferase involved in cell wall biosynthesis
MAHHVLGNQGLSMTHNAGQPAVSVVMPVFNAKPYLSDAIRSILDQTWGDFELIVADDGSTDGSARLALRYAADDDRVRVLLLPHRGIETMRIAVDAARGDLIARMDADDISEPTRLAEQVTFMREHVEVAAVGTWLTRTDPYGSPAGEQCPPTEHEAIDAALLRGEGSPIVQGTTMYRRSSLQQAGGWRSDYGWVEDLDLFLRLAEVGRLANLPRKLYRYRRHPQSVCPTNYQAMCSRIGDVVMAAHERRGLMKPDASVLRCDLPAKHSNADLYRNWACHAIHHANPRLARHHALHALRCDPWSPRSWRVMAWAIRSMAA